MRTTWTITLFIFALLDGVVVGAGNPLSITVGSELKKTAYLYSDGTIQFSPHYSDGSVALSSGINLTMASELFYLPTSFSQALPGNLSTMRSVANAVANLVLTSTEYTNGGETIVQTLVASTGERMEATLTAIRTNTSNVTVSGIADSTLSAYQGQTFSYWYSPRMESFKLTLNVTNLNVSNGAGTLAVHIPVTFSTALVDAAIDDLSGENWLITNQYITEDSNISIDLLRLVEYGDEAIGIANGETYPYLETLADLSDYIVPGCGFCRADFFVKLQAGYDKFFYDPEFATTLIDPTPPPSSDDGNNPDDGGGGDGSKEGLGGLEWTGVGAAIFTTIMACCICGIALVVIAVIVVGLVSGVISTMLVKRKLRKQFEVFSSS